MKKIHLKNGPFLKSNQNSDKMMFHLLISLIPIILFTFYKNGIYLYLKQEVNLFGMFYPLFFILIGSFSSFFFETLYHKIFLHQNLKESIIGNYAYMPGLFMSLVLPLSTPISILIMGTLFAIIFGKMLYGGFGNNIFNPALIGCLFVMALYSTQIGSYANSFEIDTISSATPLTNMSLVDKVNYRNVVSPYGNLWTFFLGMIPGSVGETCSLLILISFLYLAFTKTIKIRIPIFYVGTVFILTFFIGRMNGLSIWYPLFEILSGGLLFGTVFMATDPVTSPVTKIGQILYGVLLGILTVMIRSCTSAPEGVMTSILTMNMFVFILDKIGSTLKSKNDWIIMILVMVGFIFTLSLCLVNTLNTKNVDHSFEVVSKETKENQTIYVVNQKGNGGNIRIQITLKDHQVIDYEVLSHNETKAYYSKVESQNYIQTLIKESNHLEDIDTVSGATISSKALKKALENVLELEGVL